MTQTDVAEDPPLSHLRLTARLNTSALDARRGVVRLHPEAIAALGIREWDAVSLTGSRTTAAVAGVAPAGTPTGTALLDDVTLSNAGLREDTTVIVSAVTVYGARSVTVNDSQRDSFTFLSKAAGLPKSSRPLASRFQSSHDFF